jgi:hypothetical protein
MIRVKNKDLTSILSNVHHPTLLVVGKEKYDV